MHDGDRIHGLMTDEDTTTERSLYDLAAAAGLPPGADEKLDEHIRKLIPNAPKGPISAHTVLPKASTLEGAITGPFVRFTKTYRGESTHSYRVGDRSLDTKIAGHSVEYSGRLSPDGNAISGRWTILDPNSPRGIVDGLFELRRNCASAPTKDE